MILTSSICSVFTAVLAHGEAVTGHTAPGGFLQTLLLEPILGLWFTKVEPKRLHFSQGPR